MLSSTPAKSCEETPNVVLISGYLRAKTTETFRSPQSMSAFDCPTLRFVFTDFCFNVDFTNIISRFAKIEIRSNLCWRKCPRSRHSSNVCGRSGVGCVALQADASAERTRLPHPNDDNSTLPTNIANVRASIGDF